MRRTHFIKTSPARDVRVFVKTQFTARMRLLVLGKFSREQFGKSFRPDRPAGFNIDRMWRQTPELIPRRDIIGGFADNFRQRKRRKHFRGDVRKTHAMPISHKSHMPTRSEERRV